MGWKRRLQALVNANAATEANMIINDHGPWVTAEERSLTTGTESHELTRTPSPADGPPTYLEATPCYRESHPRLPHYD